MKFLFLASAIALSAPQMFFAKADDSGGGAAKTDLEKLQDAEAANTKLRDELKAEKEAHATKIKEAGKLTEEKDQLVKDRDAAVKEKGELATKLEAAEAEVKKLQGESKTADKKAQEIAAAHGSQPAGKDTETAAGGAKDGKALYEEYAKLDGMEAAEFWAKNEKALKAFGEAEARKERNRD